MVTKRLVKDALLHIKRCPFAMQYMPFYNAKGHVLFCQLSFLFTTDTILHLLISFYVCSVQDYLKYSLCLYATEVTD